MKMIGQSAVLAAELADYEVKQLARVTEKNVHDLLI